LEPLQADKRGTQYVADIQTTIPFTDIRQDKYCFYHGCHKHCPEVNCRKFCVKISVKRPAFDVESPAYNEMFCNYTVYYVFQKYQSECKLYIYIYIYVYELLLVSKTEEIFSSRSLKETQITATLVAL